MSDFFLNLASRVVDNQNAVRPRIAGRFEPTEPVAQLAEINEEIASGPDATLVVPDSRQQRREAGMSGLKTDAEPRVQATRPPSSSAPESVQPIDPDAAGAPGSSPAIVARPESKPAGSDGSQNTLLPPISLHAPNTDDAEPPGRNETTVVKDDAPVHKPTVVSLPAAQTAMTGSAAEGPVYPPVSTAAARYDPATGTQPREIFIARKSREMPRPAEALPPPETVVHVTIGRVELRAPAAAAPRKREQPASQPGTLAEYLQKHAARTRS